MMIALPLVRKPESPVEEALGHAFRRRDLLQRALTHRSYSNERGERQNYERLEFLGDSVLGLITARWLFDRFPDESEGELAKVKSYLVSTPVLAKYADVLELGPQLRLGVGEERSGGRSKKSILADVVEALFGAVYLDGGLEAARKVIEPVLLYGLEVRGKLIHADPKTILQELSQSRGWGLPSYRVVEEAGPDHQKVFTVECWLEGERMMGRAEGKSKKAAAQRAASQALVALGGAGGEH